MKLSIRKQDQEIADLPENKAAAFRKPRPNESEWIYISRKRAWEAYQDSPLPARINHLWKYTKPEWFLPLNIEEQMQIVPLVSEIREEQMAPLRPDFAAFGCNHGERVSYTQVSNELKSSGLVYTDLATAIGRHPDILQQYLGRLAGADFGKFEALNLALWNSGMFLYIPPGLQIKKPIYIHRHPDEKYHISRVLVVAGDNSQATIIDEYSGKSNDRPFGANSVTELFAGNNSQIRLVSVQNLNYRATSFVTQQASVGQDSRLFSIFASLGAEISKYNLGANLDGRGANSNMLGVLFGSQRQHFDHHTLHNHRAGESFSNIDFKVVLKDAALSAYTGLIRINEKTLNCEAYQENRNLLLNPGPRAESIPELEILNDQVRCTHGATVGPVDPEMIFYLKSRGFSQAEAVRAIVGGFIEPLLKRVPEDLRNLMKNMVEFKLQNGTVN